MYRSTFRTFPSFLNPRAHSAHYKWATLWSFRGFSSKTQSSFILSTITEQWKFLKKKSTPGNRIGVACTGRLICAFVVHIWQNRFSHDVTHYVSEFVYMCEERYHATVCVVVRNCFKSYIFMQHYSIIAETSYIALLAHMSNLRIS